MSALAARQRREFPVGAPARWSNGRYPDCAGVVAAYHSLMIDRVQVRNRYSGALYWIDTARLLPA